MAKRKIIRIDEEKCNGCGLCIPNCKEGALQIIDGKARLVSEVFCDGLGACLGHCPQGAITIEEREAEAFDEKKVQKHLHGAHAHDGGCPGSKIMDFRKKKEPSSQKPPAGRESELAQWPVQIMLVPPHAPYFADADLLIAADCVPFAYASFHEDLLRGKILLVGCPKLDDIEVYREKLSQIIKDNSIKSVTYAHMEVPCCFGLVGVIQDAISVSGKNIPFEEITISIKGERLK
jgi:NAD-dependent dihydropyrimidine dehydrogenase PreA subunit